MRLFKVFSEFNWKSLIVELFLMFISLYLAIAFNNWNTDKKQDEEKTKALERIKAEVQNNLDELQEANGKNKSIFQAVSDFKKYFGESTNVIHTNPDQLQALQKKHPNFFSVIDSVQVGDNQFEYRGKINFNFNLTELTEIAWEATRIAGIASQLEYNCLYEIENAYAIQRIYQAEMNKIPDLFLINSMKNIMVKIEQLENLTPELENRLNSLLLEIDQCN